MRRRLCRKTQSDSRGLIRCRCSPGACHFLRLYPKLSPEVGHRCMALLVPLRCVVLPFPCSQYGLNCFWRKRGGEFMLADLRSFFIAKAITDPLLPLCIIVGIIERISFPWNVDNSRLPESISESTFRSSARCVAIPRCRDSIFV